jgi:hypothetical protein
MKLVKDARRAWRFFSVQAMAVAGALQGAWLAVPPDLQARVPEDIVDGLTVAILALGIVGRLVDQGGGNGVA